MSSRPERPPGLTIRAFVAVNLEPSLKEVLGRVQERLKTTRADVGWVRSENLHLTLKFLGEVEEPRLSAVADALGSAARGLSPFRLAFGGLGAFPQPRAARVVWIGVSQGAEALTELQGRVEAWLEPLGFARERRPFSAHLTLGRVRGPARREQLAAVLTSMAIESLGDMAVDRIELMRSELRSGGPCYSILRGFPLG